MDYKLCILSAGAGKRMRPLTDKINKALLPVDFKAAISHVIEKHKKNVEVIIALNYEKEKIKQYLDCAHPDRKITLVDVPIIDCEGSGPGYSLLCCQKYINMPFIFSTIDTLYHEDCPIPDENWMGVSKVEDPSSFCTIKLNTKGDSVEKFIEKSKSGTNLAFIGIAGIKDYNSFFTSLLRNQMQVKGEIQVSNGFKGLIKKGLKIKKFSWFDIGNLEGYYAANKSFSSKNNEFDFSKKDEYIYFIDNKIIKYFSESNIVKNRLKRANLLNKLTPIINKKSKYFYSYKKIKGKVLYDQNEKKTISNLLKWLKEELWIPKNLEFKEEQKFYKACKDFYFLKTKNRLNNYYSRFECDDQISIINNQKIPRVRELLDMVDFDWLSKGLPTNFHGDLQFDNILLTNENKFKLLDWRQDFSGLIEYGDMYYDLAKLNGGLYISYKKIKENKFKINLCGRDIILFNEKDKFLIDSKKIFDQFVKDNNLDILKIEILTGIIFLNMAPMHNSPFSHYVYYLGKKQLNKWIINFDKIKS